MKINRFSQNKKYLINHQYKSDNNLNARIRLHTEYSINKVGWYSWLYEQFDFNATDKVLEVGCGNGRFWKENKKQKELFPNLLLSDLSFGMVRSANIGFPAETSFANIDAENIPLKSNSLDAIIASHMLYHVSNLTKVLREFIRVLKPDGVLYATTNGSDHLIEIYNLLDNIFLDNSMSRFIGAFPAEKSRTLLGGEFSNVEEIPYLDGLIVPDAKPIIDYINSMNQISEIVNIDKDEIQNKLELLIQKEGEIRITKNTVLFKASNMNRKDYN